MDDDELDRLIHQLGIQLPDVEDDVLDDEILPRLDGLDEGERNPRDWKREREDWEDEE